MRVSGSIMAKDRARTLKAAIDSIIDIVDELVYVDTGSTDGSIDIVRQYPKAVIYEHPWQDSFSEARNFSFSKCTGDWIIQIDSDEVLDPASARIYQKVIEGTSSNGLVVTMLNETLNGIAWSPVARAFRSGMVNFTHRKHNQPNITGGQMKFAPHIVYRHSGYNLSDEESKAKDYRDLRLLLMDLIENPTSTFVMRNMMRSYLVARRYDDLVILSDFIWYGLSDNAIDEPGEPTRLDDLFQQIKEGDIDNLCEILRAIPKTKLEITPSSWQMAKIDYKHGLMEMGRFDEAAEIGLDILGKYPENVDTLYSMSLLYTQMKRYREAIEYGEKYLETLAKFKANPSPTQMIIDKWGMEGLAINNMAYCYDKLGNKRKALMGFHDAAMLTNDGKVRNNFESALPFLAEGKPLKILFIQAITSTRNRKLATTLRAKGHQVDLVYTNVNRFPEGIYDNIYHISNYRELQGIVLDYDIIHCMDTLGEIAYWLAENTNALIIRDIHDLSELQSNNPLPYVVSMTSVRHVDAITFSTPQQLDMTRQIYGLDRPALVLPNFATRADIPAKKLPKLSEQDGEFHIVYEGYVGTEGHIDFLQLFGQLASNNIHVHVYPVNEIPLAYNMIYTSDEAPYIHIHETLPFDELLIEMTQYDAGIVPWNLEKGSAQFIASTIANKVFDYVLCGLPVISVKSPALEWYIKKQNIGIVYESVDNIVDNVDKLKAMDVSNKAEFMDDHIDRLIGFYRIAMLEKYKPFEPGIQPTPELLAKLEDENPDLIWQSYHNGGGKARIDRIVELARGKVLDIGCSDGLIPILCGRKGLPAIGIDTSEYHLNKAIENLYCESQAIIDLVDFKESDAEKIEFYNTEFDTTILGQILEHVIRPGRVIDEALRVMKPDGQLLVSVPNGLLRDSKHLRYFDERSFRNLLEQHCKVNSIEHIEGRMLAICKHDD